MLENQSKIETEEKTERINSEISNKKKKERKKGNKKFKKQEEIQLQHFLACLKINAQIVIENQLI
jgi:hypothetical protein